MITVYYVSKGTSFESLREVYHAKEYARFPEKRPREISYLNDEELNGLEIKYQKYVTFEDVFNSLKPVSRLVIESIHEIALPIIKLKEMLFLRKDEYIQIRLLKPNILLDPLEPNTYVMLDLASDAETGQKIKSYREIKPKFNIEPQKETREKEEDKEECKDETYEVKTLNQCRLREVNTRKNQAANIRIGPREPYPKELRTAVIKDRLAGLTYSQISQKYKVSRGFITLLMKQNNIKVQPKVKHQISSNVFLYKTPLCVEPESIIDVNLRLFLMNQRKVRTSVLYLSLLKNIFSYLAEFTTKKKISEIEDILKFDRVIEYRDQFQHKKVTIQVIKCLKIFLRYLASQNIQFVNKISSVKTQKIAYDRTKSLSVKDVEKLLKTAAEMLEESYGKSVEEQWKAHRDFLAIFLLASCGMRHTALLHLRKNDVLISEKVSKLKLLSKTMNSKYEINISEDIVEKIRTYIEIFFNDDPPDTFLFCAVNKPDQKSVKPLDQITSARNLKKIYARSGVTIRTTKSSVAHTLRVTLATQLYESGVDIHKIKDILNHSNVNQTYEYIDVSRYENVLNSSWLPKISYDLTKWI